MATASGIGRSAAARRSFWRSATPRSGSRRSAAARRGSALLALAFAGLGTLLGSPRAAEAQEAAPPAEARKAAPPPRPDLGGYIQARYSATTGDDAFSIRRAKVWLKGTAPFAEGWHYKVQAIFRSKRSGSLLLQDAFVEYRRAAWSVRIGQQVPDFSLQRHQPDWKIPVVERGQVINALIPSAESDARDIGVQAALHTADERLETAVGLFNGNGANTLDSKGSEFLLTSRTRAALPLGGGVTAHLGVSLALRESDGLEMKKIFRDTTAFVGTDFRWGTELHLTHPKWEVQAEYLRGDLEGENPWGVYALADYRVTRRDLVTAIFDKYTDLAPGTDDDPWYGLGLTHFISGQQAKIMLELRTRFAEPETRYSGVLQFQILFE